MENKILPLGSIVTLKNGDGSELMIVTRAAIIEEDGVEVYFDYGSVLIPQGMVSPENVYFSMLKMLKKLFLKVLKMKRKKTFNLIMKL